MQFLFQIKNVATGNVSNFEILCQHLSYGLGKNVQALTMNRNQDRPCIAYGKTVKTFAQV